MMALNLIVNINLNTIDNCYKVIMISR